MGDVLIVGAGPAGLTLAIELLRRNIAIRLIDASQSPFEGSRGKGVQPRSLEIFDMMGIVDSIREQGSLYPFLKIHLGPIAFKAGSLGTHHQATVDRPYPNLMMVAQWRTEQVLREQVERRGGVVEYGVGLERLDQSDRDVIVTLTNGETIRATFVVGCDGGRSTTRKAIGLSLNGKTLDDKTMIVADVQVEGLDREFWHVWPLHRGGPRSLAPLPKSNLFQLQAPERIASEGLESGILRTTGKRLVSIAWQSRFRHQLRMVDRYRVGRVFLAGDAAHIHPPSGGQGLNTGIQDAFNLGWKLASALRTNDDTILDTYELERLPIAAGMLNLTSELHGSTSTKRGELTNQLSVGYRDSPLAIGPPSGGLHPGDRMPDERFTDGRRFFEVMRLGNATQVMRPNGGHVLVRPDGYIAEFTDHTVASYYGFEVQQVEAVR